MTSCDKLPKRARAALASVALLLLLPSALLAWGDRGHEITGVIAYARLNPTARKQVDALLAGDRDTLTGPDFVSRTTWADEYRDSDRQSTRQRYERTRNWHFVNIDIASGRITSKCNAELSAGTPAHAGPADACLLVKLDQFTAELSDPSTPPPERLLALKFLLHLVGDLHHPLHVGDNADRGGNDVTVVFGSPPRRENLHWYWDNYLVERLGGDARFLGRVLDRRITAEHARLWSKGSLRDWAKESFQQARQVVYHFGGNQRDGMRGGGEVRLDRAYQERALPVAREQLAKAGVRLAQLLNGAFK